MTPRLSFEFFPPQSMDAGFRLWDTVQALMPLGPQFVSITCGTGGGARGLTRDAAALIGRNYGAKVAAHLTCAGASRAETLAQAALYAEAGVSEILALRGDAPKGAARFTPAADGFASSVELVEALARTGRFGIRVAAYAEPHPDAADAEADVLWLKRKIDAGASSAITQFFFEAETFLRFRDRCTRAGITAPIIPGILPVQGWEGVKKFAARCGATIPQRVAEGFERAVRDGREAMLALAQCSALCDRLLAEGVEDLHFYTLNRPDLTREVVRVLGLGAPAALENVA